MVGTAHCGQHVGCEPALYTRAPPRAIGRTTWCFPHPRGPCNPSKDFAEKVALVTGVRNLLVHQYEKIDRTLLLANPRKNLDDFEQYR